jgi:tetratricopeptide (TPR) repeat protein
MRFCGISLVSLGLLVSVPALADVPEANSLSGNYLASRTASHLMDLDASAQYTSAALKQDHNNGVLTERLFQAEVMQGDFTKAEPLAAQVVKFNSQQRIARLVLGLKEFRARRYAQARDNFNEAAYTPIGTLTSALLSSWAYAGEGSLNAALHELDKLDGQDAFANYKAFHAALIADYLGSSVRAEAAYKKAYGLAPTSLRIVQAYGNFLERNGRKADAEKVYHSYLADGQRDVLVQKQLADMQTAAKPPVFVASPAAGAGEVLFSVASALNSDQSADAALVYSQLALAFSADRPVVLTTLGAVQTGLKLYDQANVSFDQVPKDSVLRDYADTQIALNFQRLDQKPEAISKLEAVVAKDSKNSDALVTLAGVYRANDDLSKAADWYGQALALLPENDANTWRVYYDRGIVYDRLKQYDKSEPDFRKALALSKDDPSVLNYLGYSMIDRGVHLDEALAMVKKAVSLKPNDGFITDSLGWAYFILRDYDQAVTYCERAVDLVPSDPIIAEHLGDVYWKAGRRLEAQFQWQHAKDNHPEKEDLARIESKLKDGIPDVVEAKPAETTTPAPADPAKPTKG